MTHWHWYDPELEDISRLVKKWEKTGLLDDQLTLPFMPIMLEIQSHQLMELKE